MSDLTKLTVNLIPAAVEAMAAEAARSELSRTDVVNRALMLYAAVMARVSSDPLVFLDTAGNVVRVSVDLTGASGG